MHMEESQWRKNGEGVLMLHGNEVIDMKSCSALTPGWAGTRSNWVGNAEIWLDSHFSHLKHHAVKTADQEESPSHQFMFHQLSYQLLPVPNKTLWKLFNSKAEA